MTNHHHSSKKRKTRKRNGDSLHRDDLSLDHSQIGETLNLGTKNVAQIACALANGTEEVKDLLLNECNIIYECRHCKNFFRSFANLVTHKRAYCKGHECEQMALYDPSWFVPEQETKNNDDEVKDRVSDVVTSIRLQTKLVTKLEQKKIFEQKRKSLHLIVNSLQKPKSEDDSAIKVISTSQFYSNDAQKDDETSDVTQSQRLTLQSLMQTASPESGYTSIEESTLNTSNQMDSEKTFLSTKSETEDIINPSILKVPLQMTRDHREAKILNESLLSANENLSSSSLKTTSVAPTPIVRKNKPKPNRHLIIKHESTNAVQESSQFTELKPQILKKVKLVSSGSNTYSSSSSISVQSDLNDFECPEQVCTQKHKSATSNGKNRRKEATQQKAIIIMHASRGDHNRLGQ